MGETTNLGNGKKTSAIDEAMFGREMFKRKPRRKKEPVIKRKATMSGHEKQNSRSYSMAQLKYAFDESKVKRAKDGRFGEKPGEQKGEERPSDEPREKKKGKPKSMADLPKEKQAEARSRVGRLQGLEDAIGDLTGEERAEAKADFEDQMSELVDFVGDEESANSLRAEFDKEFEGRKEKAKKENRQSSVAPVVMGHEKQNARSYSMGELAYAAFDEGKVKRAKDGRFGETPGVQKGEERPSDKKPKGETPFQEALGRKTETRKKRTMERRAEVAKEQKVVSAKIAEAEKKGDKEGLKKLRNEQSKLNFAEKTIKRQMRDLNIKPPK